jgi:integrase
MPFMATYQERGDRVRALIRIKGHKPVSKTFRTKTLAKQWATKTEAAMLDGDHFNPGKTSVRKLIERYLKEEDTDRWTYNRLARLNREEKWVDLPLSDCQDAIALWVERRRKKVKANSVLREASVLSKVFSHAMKRWRVKLRVNPMRDIDKPTKDKARNRRVKQSEIDAIWGHFGRHEPTIQRHYIPWMFEFACETGMRLGELTKLRWEDVNPEERWVYVLPSKNGDDRNGLLTVRAVELLAGLPRNLERVFPTNVGSVGTEFRRALKELGLSDLHFHDSRHEATSRLAKWLSVLELARVVGHRDLKSLMTYYNPTPAELAAKLPGGATQPKPPHPSPTT